jgi:hypothetical protein
MGPQLWYRCKIHSMALYLTLFRCGPLLNYLNVLLIPYHSCPGDLPTTCWSASSFGCMSAVSGNKASCTSTLNHFSGISLKWDLCSPATPLTLPEAIFCVPYLGFISHTSSPTANWKTKTKFRHTTKAQLLRGLCTIIIQLAET